MHKKRDEYIVTIQINYTLPLQAAIFLKKKQAVANRIRLETGDFPS
jgi:hypothetical protein